MRGTEVRRGGEEREGKERKGEGTINLDKLLDATENSQREQIPHRATNQRSIF